MYVHVCRIIGRASNRAVTSYFLALLAGYTLFYAIVFEQSKSLNITLTPGYTEPCRFVHSCVCVRACGFNKGVCMLGACLGLCTDCIKNFYTMFVTLLTGAVIVLVLTLHVIFAARDKELLDFLAFLGMGE